MFKRLSSAEEAKTALLEICRPISKDESRSLSDSVDRVLSQDIISPVDLPGFNRAAMDGYAVVSSETRGASPSAPVYLENVEKIRTGLALPEGFDAVVMLEDAVMRESLLEVSAVVHPYRNVSRTGEDVRRGVVALEEGHCLRPPDIALLAALGIEEVKVYRRPRIAIIPTGGELVARGLRRLQPGEAYETNGLMAELYVKMWGGTPARQRIVPDDPDQILEAIKASLDADIIIVIGGTSVGEKDFAPSIISDAGKLLIHGVRIQPGKPVALGVLKDRPIICLPGYPVAALSNLYLFVRPALKKMAHLDASAPSVSARMSKKVASRPGYLTLTRVALEGGEAVPIMTSGAGIMSSVARADGFVVVSEEKEGVEAGENVSVCIFE